MKKDEYQKMAEEILDIISPKFDGKTFRFVDTVLDYLRVIVHAECRFTSSWVYTAATKKGTPQKSG